MSSSAATGAGPTVPDIIDPAERLNDLLDQEELRIATIFRTAVADLQDEIDLDELADLIEQGRHDEAIERLTHAAERLGTETNISFMTAGQSAAEFLSRAGVGRIVFNVVNTLAVAAMQANRLDLVREFTAEQRRATQTAILSGIEEGIGPRAQARNFRQSIGLTERQWAAVSNYRRALTAVGTNDRAVADALSRDLRDKRFDRTVRAAVARQRPIPTAKIERMVERYTQRFLKYRSEVIGRTEALRAVHQGNEEAYRQAIESGVLDPDRLRRTWETRLDGRERDTHLMLNGQEKRWGEPWITRHGAIRYPGDPEAPAVETIQCRCALATRIRAA